MQDRYYLKNNNQMPLAQTAMNFFKDKCFLIAKPKIIGQLLEQVTKDRNGEFCDWDLLKDAINSFVQLGLQSADIIKQGDDFVWRGDRNLDLYNQHIEKAIIDDAGQEYGFKAQQWMSSLNCPEYLDTIDKQLTKEEERADYFLQPETKSRLLRECEDKLITMRAEVLVNMDSGCDTMFANKKLDELALMYKVFRRDETTLKFILAKMGPYIIKRGDKIVKDE